MDHPKLSIIIPSFNRKTFLEASIRSVLDQNYPNLELIIIDGGSTDGSTDIIRRHENRITYWCSEPDRGQYDALQKGFARSTGEIMAWMNSDDLYFPWAFKVVSEVFTTFPNVDWITSLLPAVWNDEGIPFQVTTVPGYARRFFLNGYYMMDNRHFRRYFIQQESTFWRRSLWDAAGSRVSPTHQVGGDFELWSRFIQHSPLVGVNALLGGFRKHGDQLSVAQRQRYIDQTEEALAAAGGGHCSAFGAWVRRRGLAARWPLNILPSLGFIQPALNIRWDVRTEAWRLHTEFIT